MMEFVGSTLMAIAILCGMGYGGYVLWRRGHLRRIKFLPPPPPDLPPKG